MQLPRSRQRSRGIALIWTVVMILVLIAIVGLAIDTLHVVHASQQLQNSADAAALAGARHVRENTADARAKAIELALANDVHGSPVSLDANYDNLPEGDIVIGRFDRDTREFTPTLSGPNAVLVTARRNADNAAGRLPLLFGPIFEVNEVDLESSAIAMIGGGTGAGLITLNESERCSLLVQGSVQLHVNDGDVQVNSSNDRALCNNGQAATVYAPQFNVNGGASSTFEDVMVDGAELNTYTEETVPDPLGDLPEPAYDPNAPQDPPGVSVTGDGTTVNLSPGYYPDGIAMSSGNLNLEPGIYIVGGAGLDIRGGNLHADGVMFHIVDDGSVYLGGNGEIYIRPPDPENPVHDFPEAVTYEGISIFQARDNYNDATIIGTNDMDLEGTIYFPENHLDLSGTSDSLGNQLIVDTLDVSGNGEITIMYDGRFPAAGYRVFLVQ